MTYWPAAEVICEDTSALPRPDWLEMRRQGIGGSDAAAALGLSPFTSPVALWLDKTEGREDIDNEWFKRGRQLEGPIAAMFAEETGFEVEYHPVMLRSLAHPLMLCNFDRLVIEADGGLAILECKNIGSHNSDEWEDGPPIHYRLQGQHYLAVTGLDRLYFAALIGGHRLVIYTVERDDALIADMIAAEEAFWTLVELKRMPDIDGSDATTTALKQHYAKVERESVEVGSEMLTLVDQHHAAKALVKVAEDRLAEIDNKIIALIGDAEIATVEGNATVTRKSQTKKESVVKASTFRVLRFPATKEAK